VLKKLVARAYALEGAAGTAFYAFGDRAATQALIHDFGRGLLEIGRRRPGLEDALVLEARLAFEAHCRLFDEIAPTQAPG
jgi:heme oxygenase